MQRNLGQGDRLTPSAYIVSNTDRSDIVTTKKLKARVDGTGDLPKDVSKAAKQLVDEAAAEGLSTVGGYRVAVSTKGLVTVSSTGSDEAPAVTDDTRSVRSRTDVEGDVTVKDVNAALKSLRDKVTGDASRLVGPVKVAFTETKKGQRYLTASGTAAPFGGLLGVALDTLGRFDELESDEVTAEAKSALKPLRDAVQDTLKSA